MRLEKKERELKGSPHRGLPWETGSDELPALYINFRWSALLRSNHRVLHLNMSFPPPALKQVATEVAELLIARRVR